MFVWLVSKNKSFDLTTQPPSHPVSYKRTQLWMQIHSIEFCAGLVIMHFILTVVAIHSAGLRRCQRQSRSRAEPTEKGSHFLVNDLDAAPPEWRVGDVRSLAKTSAVTDGSITLGVAVGSRQFIADQPLGKAGVIRAMHERVQLCQDPQTEFALLRESLGVSHQPHSASVRPHDPAGETSC